MSMRSSGGCALLVSLLAAVAGCGSGGGGAGPEIPEGKGTVGTAGGTVSGPDGVELVVPPGALAADVTVRIRRTTVGAPALPGELVQGAVVYELTPHGLAFSKPVKVRLPYPGQAAADAVAFAAEQGGGWSTVPATFAGGVAELERRTLSWFFTRPSLVGGCAPRQGDPYPCQWAVALPGAVTTDPPGAIVGGTLARAATLSFPIDVSAAPDCGGGTIDVFRLGSAGPSQHVVNAQPVALASAGAGQRATGQYTFQAPVTAADNGTLWFMVRFACVRAFEGGLTSDLLHGVFAVDIQPPAPAPTITQQPADATVAAGNPVTFTLLASASAGLGVGWERSGDGGATWTAAGAGTPVAGGSTLGFNAQLADDGARFRAEVCNGAGPTRTCLTSQVAKLTVSTAGGAPVITAHPLPQTFTPGGGATLSVTATGAPTLSYAWSLGGTPLPAAGGAFTVGACSGEVAYLGGGATASLTGLTAGCAGTAIAVLVTNGIGPGAASTPAALTASLRPTILQAPQSLSVAVGQPATFAVSASGNSLTYQWQRSRRVAPGSSGPFEDLPGATADAYTIPAATLGDDGTRYAVRVCSGAAAPPYSNCWFLGLSVQDQAALTILTVASQQHALVASGTTANLAAVAFSTATIGVAVGEGGTILRTADGGATWSPVTSPTTNDLRDVAFGGTGQGVAVGGSALLHTADHGATWTALPVDPGTCCAAAAFADATTVVVARTLGREGFLRSTDGGLTYAVVATGVSDTFGVEFGSATVGAGRRFDGQLLRTADGGATWSLASQPAGGAAALAFSSPSVAVATTGFLGNLWRTTDGGATWAALYDGGVTRPSGGLAFHGAVGLSVGEGDSFGLMRTADAGVTWIPMTLTTPAGVMSAIAFADASVAVAVGEGGIILRFTNGGL